MKFGSNSSAFLMTRIRITGFRKPCISLIHSVNLISSAPQTGRRPAGTADCRTVLLALRFRLFNRGILGSISCWTESSGRARTLPLPKKRCDSRMHNQFLCLLRWWFGKPSSMQLRKCSLFFSLNHFFKCLTDMYSQSHHRNELPPFFI